MMEKAGVGTKQGRSQKICQGVWICRIFLLIMHGHISMHFLGFYNRNEFIWMEGVEPGRPPINAWFKALFTRFLGFDI